MESLRRFIGRLFDRSSPPGTSEAQERPPPRREDVCRAAVEMQHELQQRLPPGTRVHVQLVSTIAPGVVRVTGYSGCPPAPDKLKSGNGV